MLPLPSIPNVDIKKILRSFKGEKKVVEKTYTDC